MTANELLSNNNIALPTKLIYSEIVRYNKAGELIYDKRS